MRPLVTLERLRELFHYDPETGNFVRLVATTNCTKVGEIAGRRKIGYYVNMRVDGRIYKAHRLAWLYMTGEWPDLELDHENTEPSDNSWKNLRQVTHQQNLCNMKAVIKKPGNLPRGVFLHRDGVRFQSQIRLDGRTKYLGLFDTPESAHQAWLKIAVPTRGEFLAPQFRAK